MISEVIQTEVVEEQYLTFNLGDNLVGIQLGLVETIEFVPEIIPIPRAPNHVVGVANIENAIIPILDLEVLLKFKDKMLTEKTISIIIAIESAVFGIHIAEPPKVVLVETKLVDPPSKSNGKIPKKWVDGYFVDTLENMITILDPKKFWIGLGKSEISGPASGSKSKAKNKKKEASNDNVKESPKKKKEVKPAETNLEELEVKTKDDNGKKSKEKKEVKLLDDNLEKLEATTKDEDKNKPKKKKKQKKAIEKEADLSNEIGKLDTLGNEKKEDLNQNEIIPQVSDEANNPSE